MKNWSLCHQALNKMIMTRENIIRLFLMLVLAGCVNDLLAQQNKAVKNKSTVALSDEETVCARVFVNPYPTNNLQYLDNWAHGTIWFAMVSRLPDNFCAITAGSMS
jgi:hypothetical protein